MLGKSLVIQGWLSRPLRLPNIHHQSLQRAGPVTYSWQASIIPVDTIVSSVHLFLRIVQNIPHEHWNTFTVLERCQTFYVNPFSDRDIFLLFSQKLVQIINNNKLMLGP